jgi:hypothetical protein
MMQMRRASTTSGIDSTISAADDEQGAASDMPSTLV